MAPLQPRRWNSRTVSAVRCLAAHVHPLKACYQQPVELPPWGQVYADATLPLHLDIGCGYGALHQHGPRPTFCP